MVCMCNALYDVNGGKVSSVFFAAGYYIGWLLCTSSSYAEIAKYLVMFPVDLLGLQTTSVKAARKLGVIFDTNFSFRSHVSAVCRSCRYHIRDLRRICRYLSLDSAKLLAHALVSSRLDYCNSLLFGIADKEIIRPRRIQNSLARVVTKQPPLTRSVPLLRSLHWLPLKFRIEFKTCLLTYKTFNENQPGY